MTIGCWSDPNNAPHHMPNLVIPYSEESSRENWHEAEHDIGSPAGGAISTADELVRFADCIRSEKLISSITFERLIRPNARSPAEFRYASWGYVIGAHSSDTKPQCVCDTIHTEYLRTTQARYLGG